MQGFRVLRKAGWDTHGLPVELEIEKKLGLKSKKDIEKYGIAKFNQKCRESVWNYKKDWERITERIGFWLDMENPYITYQPEYIETVWWIIKQVWERGLLYQDYKIVPYCPRCGTSLSSHEVAQGYEKIKEPAICIKFKITKSKSLFKEGDYLLAWTTTPWTLPANVALAVNEKFEYVRIKINNEFYILDKSDLTDVKLFLFEVDDSFNDVNFLNTILMIFSNIESERNKFITVTCSNKDITIESTYGNIPANYDKTLEYNKNKKYSLDTDFIFFK